MLLVQATSENPKQYWWYNNAKQRRGYMYEEIMETWLEYREWMPKGWRPVSEDIVPDWARCLADGGTDCYKIETQGPNLEKEKRQTRFDEELGIWLPDGLEHEDGWEWSAYNDWFQEEEVFIVRQFRCETSADCEEILHYYKDGEWVEPVQVKFDPVEDQINPWLEDIVEGKWESTRDSE